MKKKKVIIVSLLTLLVLMVVLASSCAQVTKIGDIKASPSQYANKEVTVKGTVNNSFWFSLLSKGAYEISDSSGTIWVVVTQTPPVKMDIIQVSGTVQSAITVGDRSLGTVIAEKTRKKL